MNALITFTDLADIIPFLLLLAVAIAGLAYTFGYVRGVEIGHLTGRNAAEQARPAAILKAKLEGAMAERQLWVQKSRLDLKPKGLNYALIDTTVAGQSMIIPELPDDFSREEYVRLAQERAERATDTFPQAQAALVALQGLQDTIRSECDPGQPTTTEAVERATI